MPNESFRELVKAMPVDKGKLTLNLVADNRCIGQKKITFSQWKKFLEDLWTSNHSKPETTAKIGPSLSKASNALSA